MIPRGCARHHQSLGLHDERFRGPRQPARGGLPHGRLGRMALMSGREADGSLPPLAAGDLKPATSLESPAGAGGEWVVESTTPSSLPKVRPRVIAAASS